MHNISGVSSAPGRPSIELSTRAAKNPEDDTGVTDEINIVWSVPDDDGGYPLTGMNLIPKQEYILQKSHWISY